MARSDRSRWTDHDIELLIGRLLRAGVVAAALVATAGGALYLLQRGDAGVDYRTFHGEPQQLRTVSGVVAVALRGDGRGIIAVGLLLLIATPIARVGLSLVGFAKEGDRRYVAITTLVLLLLLFSLIGTHP